MSHSRLQQLQEFLAASPGDAFILFAIAKEYEKLGQQEEALAQYLELQQLHPQYVGLYYHLGKLYEQLGDAQKGWDTYTAGMKVAREINDRHALSELAGARLNLGDEEDFE